MVRALGVQTEMELAFATVHQMCAPLLDCLEGLPGPQRDALQTVFGQSAGTPPDRFLTGLAVLSLLSEAAVTKPLLCLVDDVQWADQASAQVLAFAARRLGTESVGLVLGTRVVNDDLAGLQQLAVEGLRETDARLLLEAALTVPIDAQIRDRIVAETHGNPLALLELPRALTAAELAGGFGLPGLLRLPGSTEESFQASCYDGELTPKEWALVELVEAAVRTKRTDTAAEALARFAGQADASGTDWARHRCALPCAAEPGRCRGGPLPARAGHLARTRMRPDLARTHLLYGEWLRRERRRAEARDQLRTAHAMLEAIGMEAFAERARRELGATGETARKRADATSDRKLTAQERQIAQLACDGMSNPEIGSRLFLSARTVQYHLGNIFAKLGISSRTQLGLVLPTDAAHGVRA